MVCRCFNWKDLIGYNRVDGHFFSSGGVKELKGKFLIKGKRLNKLNAVFSNNNSAEVDSVSEEDEAGDSKENGDKAKPKV